MSQIEHLQQPPCPAVPPYSPAAMPTQNLRDKPEVQPVVESWLTHTAQLLAFGGASLLTVYATYEMWVIVSGLQATVLQWAWLVLFVLSFGWIAFSAASALAGLLPTRRKVVIKPDKSATSAPALTALVMPVYNEDPADTCAALEVMAKGLVEIGRAQEFEVFIISDTRDPLLWVKETAGFQRLREQLAESIPVWYRRRYDNRGRKAGNVRSFISDWGGRYEYIVILDADSLLDPTTMTEMVDRMKADPALGLLQTVPRLHRGETLFARLQQFAGFLYGPTVARGVAAWQGRSGNFWGHNAILRVSAFAASCGLPELVGKPPFGGSILSHDFVEAALMRRAGWRVTMAPDLEGSWEEAPPTLLDVAARDRRWAQGNLQHLKVIPAQGLAWPNRAHLIIGIMSYLASPLWLAMIALGFLIAIQALLTQPTYFSEPFQLFPNWPQFDAERMIGLFVFSMAVLLTPKAIGFVSSILDRRRRQAAGGGWRLTVSTVIEVILSALYAPILMMIQSHQIYQILRGRDAGWRPQCRSAEDKVHWRDVWGRHWFHVLVAVCVGSILAYLSPILLAWLSPTLLGLLLAPWLSAYSGSSRVGRALARARLLMISEETHPPPLYSAYARAQQDYHETCAKITPQRLAEDGSVRRRHFDSVLPPPAPERGLPDAIRLLAAAKIADAQDISEIFHWLGKDELLAVLADRELFERISVSGTPAPLGVET